MKKTILFSILIITLFIAGCMPKYVCPDGTTAYDPKKCPQIKQMQEVAEELEEMADKLKDITTKVVDEPKDGNTYITIPEKHVEPAFQDFLDKVMTYDNYEYTYKKIDMPKTLKVNLKGNRIRYSFEYPDQYDKTEFYNTVVLDLDKKEAYQYCEGSRCDLDSKGFARKIDFEERKIPTLQEVMDSIVEAKIIGDEMVMDRSSKRVSYVDKDGTEGTIWVDKYYGVPLKKQYMIGDKTIKEDFTGFIKDGIKDSMVTVPSELELIA